MALEVVVPQDIIEQILVRADVKAVIRFKSVCKSMQSLICDGRFIKAHLNHSYNNDRNNQKMGHRSIVMSRDNMPYNVQWYYSYTSKRNLIGSSNGLVCISTSHGEGFGYDSSTDYYKVIVGSSSDYLRMSFQVLSLKTNVWKDVGKLKYMCANWYNYGILSKGKLHWFMKDQNAKKDVILSFDLSEEKFEEISQPRDFKYEPFFHLGIIDECLCIWTHVVKKTRRKSDQSSDLSRQRKPPDETKKIRTPQGEELTKSPHNKRGGPHDNKRTPRVINLKVLDYSAAVHYANEPGVQKGARHYQRRYHYVRECVELDEINILKVHIDNNLADPFTKALSNRKLTQHARGMGLRSASSFM
ncbi:putative F-box domain-containing protein [Tanacetum coccineum]